jgi:hypothetical protein
MQAIKTGVILLALAAAYAQGPGLQGRIMGREGPRNARRWTFEIRNGGPKAVSGVTLAGIQFAQTGTIGGAPCTPAVKSSLPVKVGTLAAGGSALASVTVDFSGCSNTAKFNVQVNLAGSGGASGTIQRGNEYR